jgi:hypothetical protein
MNDQDKNTIFGAYQNAVNKTGKLIKPLTSNQVKYICQTMKRITFSLTCLLCVINLAFGQSPDKGKKNPGFFPIGVWMQNPSNAEAYKAIGVNLFIETSGRLDEDKLNMLRKADIKVITSQRGFGLSHLNDTTIFAWLQMDEPDNAQPNGKNGYGPPVKPDTIISRYKRMKARDPSRPVYIGLGMGVADPDWVGRGVDTHKTDMYPKYVQGADIVSYDIYPVNNNYTLNFVPKGIDNLHKWTENKKPVWCTIEASNYNNTHMPTPVQIKSEVWMALIHGAEGVLYFCHQFKPSFIEAYPISDPVMKEGLTSINQQIKALAPVLNSPSVTDYASVTPENPEIPIDIMAKSYRKDKYLFAVAMKEGQTKATFKVKSGKRIEVLGENRTISIKKGAFSDDFSSYGVHLYKVK